MGIEKCRSQEFVTTQVSTNHRSDSIFTRTRRNVGNREDVSTISNPRHRHFQPQQLERGKGFVRSFVRSGQWNG